MTQKQEPEAYSVRELEQSRIFGSRTKIYGMLRDGLLDSYLAGGVRRIPTVSVRACRAALLEATRKNGFAPVPNLKHQRQAAPPPSPADS